MSRKRKKTVWCPPYHPITTAGFRLVSTAPGLSFSVSVENFKDRVLEEAFSNGLEEVDDPLRSLWEAAREAADRKVFFEADQLRAAEDAVQESMLDELMRAFSGHVFAEVVSCYSTTERHALPEDLLRRSLEGCAWDWTICWDDEPAYADTALCCAANYLDNACQQTVFLRDPVTCRSAPALVFALPGEAESAPKGLMLSAGELNDDILVSRARDFVCGDPVEYLGMDRDSLPYWADPKRLDEARNKLIAACPITPVIEYADTEHDGEYEETAVTAAKIRTVIGRLAAETTGALGRRMSFRHEGSSD